MRGGSGSGEIAPVKAILCQFSLQSLVVAQPYALPAIFKCTGGGGIGILYTRHHLNLRYYMESKACKIEFTCLKSNLQAVFCGNITVYSNVQGGRNQYI